MMTRSLDVRRLLGALVCAALAAACPGRAAVADPGPCNYEFPAGRPDFPKIPICAFPGAYQDSTLLRPDRCVGSFNGPLPDSVREVPTTISVRFVRDRRAEIRPDFGGYRIYRVTNTLDTTRMVLIRRFSRQQWDERTWNFSTVTPDTTRLAGGAISVSLPFKCNGKVVNDSVVTFVDPDSNGNYIKVCRNRRPQDDPHGLCLSLGDSVFVLDKPPGPHDGFLTWYAVTYEAKNVSLDGTYEDMFVPDTTGIIGPCGDPLDHRTCPNLNNRATNVIAQPVEPTGGPVVNLERVAVVPNPYRANEAWDRAGTHEIHFINLPQQARIKVYTLSGDLIVELKHSDSVRDFERWNLKNQDGHDVASGIYMYRVEAERFEFQDRFVVIR